ncbi:MAG TPA: STAS domain-containing protein [Armatimonadota bacterium]|nr:STAS domain-containing protein [Armatimonadota bacterium]
MRPSPSIDAPTLLAPVHASEHGLDICTAETGSLALARINGPLDLATAPHFLNRLQPLFSPRRRVVLDLRGVDYIDSDGVRALLRVQQDVETDSGAIRLVVRPGSRVARTLSLLRLEHRFEIFESALDAWIRRPKRACC